MANIEQQLPNQHLWAFYETSGGSVNILDMNPQNVYEHGQTSQSCHKASNGLPSWTLGKWCNLIGFDENIAEPHANIRKRTLYTTREYEDIMFLSIHI